MSEFYETDTEELTFIPFDIETTGFKSAEDDFVTTFILHHESAYQIWINTDGERVSASEIKAAVLSETDLDNAFINVCETEAELLENVNDYLGEQDDENLILTAFNGETWRGKTDFDVPFLRTRCLRNGVEWIFDGLWYTDTYEVFGQSSRFDTTIQDNPSLESMKKDDLEDLVDDMGFDINYAKMLKDDIVKALEENTNWSTSDISVWAANNLPEDALEKIDAEDVSSFNTSHLKAFIDDQNLDISYDKMTSREIVSAIEDRRFTEEMLVEWHEETGRDIGNREATTLDDIHEVLLEDMVGDEQWRRSLPFECEVFEPFDPFESSGEAVTEYMEGNFTGVILHCFADVARTVNITRMMVEYVPKKDYKPKVL